MPRTPKLHFVENFSEGDTDQQLEAMKKVFQLVDAFEADVLLCASIFKLQEAMMLKAMHQKPVVVYCWDYYKWAHEGMEPLWQRYAAFMRHADLILVPSSTQQLRLKELLGLDSVVVKTGILTYDHDVTDGNFILDPLRYYPEEQSKWAEKAALELGIPIIHSEHRYNQEEFRKLVASCTFMTTCVSEASTGALTLMEGLWLGKTSLFSDSPYQGANDYVGEFGHTFKDGDYEDLKKQMLKLWTKRPKVNIVKARQYMNTNFSFEKMASDMRDAICEYT